jgi:hypothetical protein
VAPRTCETTVRESSPAPMIARANISGALLRSLSGSTRPIGSPRRIARMSRDEKPRLDNRASVSHAPYGRTRGSVWAPRDGGVRMLCCVAMTSPGPLRFGSADDRRGEAMQHRYRRDIAGGAIWYRVYRGAFTLDQQAQRASASPARWRAEGV